MTTLRSRRFAVAVLIGLGAITAGCTSWFDPGTDDVVDPGALGNPAAVQTLLDGARRDFALAYVGTGDGGTEGMALVSGLVADEYDNSDTYPTRQEMDQRDMSTRNSSLQDVYTAVHRARAAADAAAAKARELTPADIETIAELQVLAGMTILSFAEDYCSGVPLSHLDGDLIVFGDQMTTEELYQAALAKFDSARSLDPGAYWTQVATVGVARAYLGLGRLVDAGAAAATVPTSLLYTTFHSEASPALQNAIFAFVDQSGRWTVGSGMGGGLDFVSAEDPRVPVAFAGAGFDRSTAWFVQFVFPSLTSPVPILSGLEARLIEAEAKLGTDPAGALAILNDLRGQVGMDPLSDAGTVEGRENQLFEERAFWLFSTDRRLGDLRRLVRLYGRDREVVFPSGEYFKGGLYGEDVNIPVSNAERNNPKVGLNGNVCLDRNP